MKGEIATSTIIWISIALIVLVVVIGGVVFKIIDGQEAIGLEECRITNDADDDGFPDKLDDCPCTDKGTGCWECAEYKNCES